MHRQTIFKRIDQQANILHANSLSNIFAESIDKEHDKLRERLDENEIINACKVYLSTEKQNKPAARLVMDEAFLHAKFAIDAYTSNFLGLKVNGNNFKDVFIIAQEIQKESPSIAKLIEHSESLKLSISIETKNKKFEIARNNIIATSNQVITEVVTQKGCTIL